MPNTTKGTVGRCIFVEGPWLLIRMVRCEHMLVLSRLTALHLASGEGHTETVVCLVKTIVESGADVHDKDEKGYGVELHCAAHRRLPLLTTTT